MKTAASIVALACAFANSAYAEPGGATGVSGVAITQGALKLEARTAVFESGALDSAAPGLGSARCFLRRISSELGRRSRSQWPSPALARSVAISAFEGAFEFARAGFDTAMMEHKRRLGEARCTGATLDDKLDPSAAT